MPPRAFTRESPMRARATDSAPGAGVWPPRAIGFWGGLSANVLNMIGIGPFVTIPLALSALAGPGVLLGWIAGAVLCLCGGMVWGELGSTIPEPGGPYHYLREA